MKRGKERSLGYYKMGIVFHFIISFTTISYSQNCVQTLKKASLAYDEGRISQVPFLLEECMGNGFNKEEKAAAYRLLTLTYIYLDEPVKADESILQLLKLNPEYKINTAVDPAEFINLYNKYRTKPIFNIGLKGGINWMFIDVREPVLTNGNSQDPIEMKSKTGFQLGAIFEVLVRSEITFSAELLYATREFRYNYTISEENEVYSEKLNLISLPLLLKYNIGKREFVPFLTAGGELSYLVSSFGNTSGDLVSPSTNFTPYRDKIIYAAIVGTGVKTKFGPGIITFGLRFMYGLNYLVEKSNVYSGNGSWALSFGSAPSFYNINTLNFNVGYLIPVYKPKKIKL